MRNATLHISLLLLVLLTLLSCGRTPRGVMSVNEMADLIVDLQLALFNFVYWHKRNLFLQIINIS